MATPVSIIRSTNAAFKAIRSINDLCDLLDIDELKLALLANHPRYKVFKIRKNATKFRTIEDPEPLLKETLSTLNTYLQAVYYYQRPSCAHGFTITASGDEYERNIVSNASFHIGKPYLLNIDLKDFFHQVKFAQVMSIFKDILNKEIDLEVLKSLSEITTYKGRLPMGSPTSPVISNFAMLNTDFELLNWCMAEKIEYTRYADDLSFSSDTPFSNETFIRIKDVLHHYGFEINPSKVKFYNKSDQKIVTGIVVGDTGLGLQEDYFTKLEKEIEIYKNTIFIDTMYRTGMSQRKLEAFKQELVGKLNFARMVCTAKEEIDQLSAELESDIAWDNLSSSWLDIPYSFKT